MTLGQVEQIGRPWQPSVVDGLEIARAHAEIRDSPPVARCHPDRPMHAVGLCVECYAAAQRHSRRTNVDVPIRKTLTAVLSPRELEVIGLVSAGLTNGQIAQRARISEQTVKNHMSAILRKTGAASRAQVAAMAASGGFARGGIDPETNVETATPRVEDLDVWAGYFAAIEANLSRLRRDVNDLIGRVRDAKRVVYTATPTAEPRLAGDPDRIVPSGPFRNRGIRCRAGHLFTERNTRITKRGGRHCRTCARDKGRVLAAAQRAALRRERAG